MAEVTESFYSAAYSKGFGMTVRFLLSKGVYPDLADELAQAAWVRGWEARHQLKDRSTVVAWVNTIAFREFCVDWRNRRKEGPIAPNLTSKGMEPSTTRIDAKKLVKRCCPLDRSLLQHHLHEGLSMRETGLRHGLTDVATRVRIHRAYQRLRKYVMSPSSSRFPRLAACQTA